jgi:S-adenosylmethionine:tRNA ribosyltransferase-isomerase
MPAVLEHDARADSALALPLDPSLEAHEPPEVWGRGRDNVRLLVSNGATDVEHATFPELPRMLRAGDALVVNTSATIPAAIDATLPTAAPLRIHFSTEMPGGLWLVEARELIGNTTAPFFADLTGVDVSLAGGGHLHLFERFADSQRLWLASPHLASTVFEHLARNGMPIGYKHAPGSWPLSAYQQIFGVEPGSAEMPSASRPFTPEIVVDLVRRGITIVPILLHTGVSSLEAHEMPYPERYRVSDATAAHVNAVHRAGGRVIAAGTTVVRALETVTDPRGVAHPGEGWTELVVTPERGVRAVDGLLTGWHEPEATHLLMLEAIAGRPALETAYSEAHRAGYLWHEFGDSHLLLPERG